MGLSGLLSCASRPPQSVSKKAHVEEEKEDRLELLRPWEILRILEESKIEYAIETAEDLEPVGITEIVEASLFSSRQIHPYLEIKKDQTGSLRLVSSRPPEDVAEVFKRAGEAFSAKDYQEARRLYAQATELNPNYFKSYTFLGNASHFLEDYETAVTSFSKALELNPIDYQSYLFLGETLLRQGRVEEAKQSMTRAFMLNRNNVVVRKRMVHILDKLKLRVRAHRFAPRVRVERVEQAKVLMRFDQTRGLRWMPLVSCMACWKYEESCKGRLSDEEDPLHLSMYRECLINQVAAVAARREQDRRVQPDELALFRAVRNGFLDAVLFWEVAVQKFPVVVLLLPPEMQEQVLRYIETYVFVSSDFV